MEGEDKEQKGGEEVKDKGEADRDDDSDGGGGGGGIVRQPFLSTLYIIPVRSFTVFFFTFFFYFSFSFLNLQLWTSLFFFVLKLKKHFNISFFF
jgi:hypothetical protein